MVGSNVTVTLKSNLKYSGIFHTAQPPQSPSSGDASTMLSLCLKMARKHLSSSSSSFGPFIPTLIIMGKDVADIQATNINLLNVFSNNTNNGLVAGTTAGSGSALTAADVLLRQQGGKLYLLIHYPNLPSSLIHSF